MRKSILRASAGFQALAIMGAGVTASFFAAAPAVAQDYTSGGLTGTVTSPSGAPVAGATVTARSLTQGQVQTTTTNALGQFSFSSLAAGAYDVNVNASGSAPFTATAVDVQPGRTTNIPVALAARSAAAGGGAIVVTGRRIQAFTGTTTGRNVDVAELVKTIPVGRSLTDVTLLAPGTTKGDSSFGNLASIGGASVAENAYYINGLNITNFDNYLGSATVPFDFYKTVEVKSGGYPAEYGRATGGIVNATSKAGTNDWMGAVHANWAPDFLRSNGKDLINCSGTTTIVCAPYTRRRDDKSSSRSLSFELGGPIIRDRLFVYGLLQDQHSYTRTVSVLNGNSTVDTNNSPFWAAKIDAFPIDNHHLEFTIFDTRNVTRREVYDYFPATGGGAGTYGTLTSTRDFNGGGVNYVGRYTGRFTDWLTLSASYGRMRDRFDSPGLDAGATAPYIVNASGGPLFGVVNGGLYGSQTASSTDSPYTTERKFWRGDADVYAHFFGSHHFRFGLDREDDTLNHKAIRTGGAVLCNAGFLTAEACTAAGVTNAGAALIFRPALTTGPNAGIPIVEVNYYNSGGQFTSTNTAYYAEDQWDTPLRGLTLNLGVRRDDFVVKNPVGANFISLKKNYAPRLGFTYDAFPSMHGQFFGSYGWYYLPIASNTAFRATSAEYYLKERFFTSGFDANGIPILTGPATGQANYSDACAIQLTPLSGANDCNQTSDGSPKNPQYYLAKNLKPTRESEWILGYRQKLADFNVSVQYTHRQTDNLNEDASFDQAIINYCHANGIAGCDTYYTTGSAQFAIANVGKDVTLLVGPGGPLAGKTITIPAKLTGYPKAKRTYDGIDFVFDRPWDGRWSLGGSYTLSWSKGNSEGFVNSDIGQGDAGVLQDWDFPGFMQYAYGYLPNDRRHRIKVFGAFAPIPDLILGANVNIESPRHLSCFGWNPNDLWANNYNSAANHYCNLKPVPRGTAQHSDWSTTVNLSARYNIHTPVPGVGVTLRADVFNVFNSRPVLYRNEVGDLGVTATDPVTGLPTAVRSNPNYGQPRVYGAPRYVRLGLDAYFGGPAPVAPAPVIAPPPPPPPAAPATITCPDGLVILANQSCPVPPPPPAPPAPAPERGQ